MKKIALIILAGASAAVLGLTAAPQSADANKACVSTKFSTKLVADACKKGGQAEAKKVMKKFLAKAKQTKSDLNCQSCHVNLAPKYDLKPDALSEFKKYGGK